MSVSRRTLLLLVVLVLVLVASSDASSKKKGKRSKASSSSNSTATSDDITSNNSTEKHDVVWHEAVSVLAANNWTELVVAEPEGAWIIDFFSGGCTHCQELHPIWEGLAMSVQNLMKVGAVNCDDPENNVICSIYAPTGFPSIAVFGPGVGEQKRPFTYRYERTPKGLIELVMGNIPRVSRLLETETQLDTWFHALPTLPRCVYVAEAPSLDFRYNAIAYALRKRMAFAQIRTTNKLLANNFVQQKTESDNKSAETLVCFRAGQKMDEGTLLPETVSFPNCSNFIWPFALEREVESNLTSIEFHAQMDVNETISLPYKEVLPERVRADLEEASTASLVQFCHRWMPNCEAIRVLLPGIAESLPASLSLYYVDLDQAGGKEVFDRLRLDHVPTTAVFPGKLGVPVVYSGTNSVQDIVSWVKEWVKDQQAKLEL